jgi:peptidyl-prolyl cis-trans isomerase B (cyclophilin B)
MKFLRTLPVTLALLASFAQLHAQTPSTMTSSAPSSPAAPISDIHIVMKTTKGDIAITVLASQTPVTAASFLNLAAKKYYDGLTFHRVIDNFMIQGGDPTGTGTGGPGYRFEDEFRPSLRFDGPGYLAMANSGPRTNGSQFFITHVATPHLNDKHTIFGKVTKGQNVVNAIKGGDKIVSIEILDSTAPLFAAQAANIELWNKSIKK